MSYVICHMHLFGSNLGCLCLSVESRCLRLAEQPVIFAIPVRLQSVTVGLRLGQRPFRNLWRDDNTMEFKDRSSSKLLNTLSDWLLNTMVLKDRSCSRPLNTLSNLPHGNKLINQLYLLTIFHYKWRMKLKSKQSKQIKNRKDPNLSFHWFQESLTSFSLAVFAWSNSIWRCCSNLWAFMTCAIETVSCCAKAMARVRPKASTWRSPSSAVSKKFS